MTLEKCIVLFERILTSGVKYHDAMGVAVDSLEIKTGETVDWTIMTQALNFVYHNTPTEIKNQIQAERDLNDHKSTETN